MSACFVGDLRPLKLNLGCVLCSGCSSFIWLMEPSFIRFSFSFSELTAEYPMAAGTILVGDFLGEIFLGEGSLGTVGVGLVPSALKSEHLTFRGDKSLSSGTFFLLREIESIAT